MKFIKLYTGEDKKSHFMEVDAGVETKQPLGNYSKNYPATGMMFRDFDQGVYSDPTRTPIPVLVEH